MKERLKRRRDRLRLRLVVGLLAVRLIDLEKKIVIR
jgi:hypothetical protein